MRELAIEFLISVVILFFIGLFITILVIIIEKDVRHFVFPFIKTEAYKAGLTCISFTHFGALYLLAKSNFHLHDYYVEYLSNKVGTTIYFNTYSDIRKYKRWRKKQYKEKNLEKLLEVIQDAKQFNSEQIKANLIAAQSELDPIQKLLKTGGI